MSKRILFIVNGLGLGNSTRCHAIIQHLENNGHQIEIITSGNGEWYFSQHGYSKRVHSIQAFNYQKNAEGKLSIAKTLATLPDMFRVSKQNKAIMRQIIDRFKPQAIVTDSIYASFKKYGIPHIALNNSEFIHSFYHQEDKIPPSIRGQFYAIEEMDYLFHKYFPTHVISPVIYDEVPIPSGPFSRVGPIVRSSHFGKKSSAPSGRVVIMLSGSSFGTPINLNGFDLPFDVDVVGRGEPEEKNTNPRVTYHGKIAATAELLNAADALVVNGGFSAVSEAYCLRKPTVVVPVPNHAEQWINARTIQKMGLGEIADEKSYIEKLLQMWNNLSLYTTAYKALPAARDGASEAASVVEKAI